MIKKFQKFHLKYYVQKFISYSLLFLQNYGWLSSKIKNLQHKISTYIFSIDFSKKKVTYVSWRNNHLSLQCPQWMSKRTKKIYDL